MTVNRTTNLPAAPFSDGMTGAIAPQAAPAAPVAPSAAILGDSAALATGAIAPAVVAPQAASPAAGGLLERLWSALKAFLARLFGSPAPAPSSPVATAEPEEDAAIAARYGLLNTPENVAAFRATLAVEQSEADLIGPGVGDPAAITELQQLLSGWGYTLSPTGTLDPATAQALLDWKTRHGLTESFVFANGQPGVVPYVDDRTRQAMLAVLNASQPVVPAAPTAPLAPTPPITPVAEAPVQEAPPVAAPPVVTPPKPTAPTPPVDPVPAVPAKPAPVPSGPTSSFKAALGAAKAGQPLALGTGTYALSNFGDDLLGVDLPSSVRGIAGQGVDRTIIEMTPHTSTRAKNVPTEKWTTNQLSLLRVNGASPKVHDLTIRATEQGHLYNGLRMNHTTNAEVSNLKIVGVLGNSDIPPGETFGINDFRTDGSVYRHVEIDGKGVGASGFATNSSKNVTVDHGKFYGSGYAHGATFWQTENVTITDTISTDNKDCGFNFERVSGTVNIVRPVVKNNKYGDFRVVSDQASAKVTIVDPVFSGAKLRIRLSHTYMGKPCVQRKEDIKVIINGVDRTKDVVEWVYSN